MAGASPQPASAGRAAIGDYRAKSETEATHLHTGLPPTVQMICRVQDCFEIMNAGLRWCKGLFRSLRGVSGRLERGRERPDVGSPWGEWSKVGNVVVAKWPPRAAREITIAKKP